MGTDFLYVLLIFNLIVSVFREEGVISFIY